MENVSGEDLSWFFREWFFTNWKLDQGIKTVKYIDEDETKGALITIENLEEMAMPVVLAIKQTNGTKDTILLPAEIWQRGNTWTFRYKSISKITSITIDPNHDFPDVNTSNNVWVNLKPVAKGTTPQMIIDKYLNAIGGVDKLSKITDFYESATGNIQGVEVILTIKQKMPGNYYYEISLPSMGITPIKIIANKDSVVVQQNGQSSPISDDKKAELKSRSTIFQELSLKTSDLQLGPNMVIVGETLAYVVIENKGEGFTIKRFYDETTGLKVKEVVEKDGNTVSTEYSNYVQLANGVKIPYSKKGELSTYPIEYKVKEAKVNSNLKESDFR